MYTAKILRKTQNLQTKKLSIDVGYYLDANVEPTATETITFGIEVTMPEIARRLNSEISRLEMYDMNLAQIVEGDVNLALADETPMTQEEKDKRAWFRNFMRLEQLTKLNTLGALKPDLVADLDSLRATVSAGFKKAYIADM
jgi:hypothetical protein